MSKSSKKVHPTREGIQVVRELLQKHDYDGNGRLDSGELIGCLAELGVFCTQRDAAYLSKCLDKDGNGHLEIEEVVSNWDTIMKHSVLGDELLDAFRTFDDDEDGTIRLPELQKALTSMGDDPLTGAEAGKVIEDLMKYDSNRDGKFSYGEFLDMLLGEDDPFGKPEMEQKSLLEQQPDYQREEDKPVHSISIIN